MNERTLCRMPPSKLFQQLIATYQGDSTIAHLPCRKSSRWQKPSILHGHCLVGGLHILLSIIAKPHLKLGFFFVWDRIGKNVTVAVRAYDLHHRKLRSRYLPLQSPFRSYNLEHQVNDSNATTISQLISGWRTNKYSCTSGYSAPWSPPFGLTAT